MSRDPALEPDVAPADLARADWMNILDAREFAILRDGGTERPGTGRYLNEERAGAYHCAGCGNALYSGAHKFHSGCGWPSFFQAAAPDALRTVRDTSHGMVRVEMRCARCDGHLGHIFEDAPQTPTGTRHCVNGFALVFVPQGTPVAEALAAHRARNQG